MAQTGPGAMDREVDARALGEAKQGAIYGMIGLLLGVVGTFVLYSTGGLGFAAVSCNSVTDTCSYPSSSVGLLWGAFAIEAIGVIIGILFVLKFRSAFQTLKPLDSRFQSPASLSILLIVGYVFLLLGTALVTAGVASVIGSCTSASYQSCLNAVNGETGLLLGGLGAIVLALILVLIGGIMLLIGIWRLGTRYNEGLFKAGAILLIIPFLDIAAPFLIYFGAKGALEKLPSSGGGMMGGSAPPPFAPPPPPGWR